jgi:hypothetical protein
MNSVDRKEMSDIKSKIELLEQNQTNMSKKMDRVLMALEDDRNSNQTGLITKVNDLKDEVERLMYLNASIKKVFWWIMGIVGSIVGLLIKALFIDD